MCSYYGSTMSVYIYVTYILDCCLLYNITLALYCCLLSVTENFGTYLCSSDSVTDFTVPLYHDIVKISFYCSIVRLKVWGLGLRVLRPPIMGKSL